MLLASEFLFRQLSAVFTGLAIYCCLTNSKNKSQDIAQTIGWLLLAGLTLYVFSISNISGRVLFCLCPTIILGLSISSKQDFTKQSSMILFGFLIGLSPQIIDLIIKGNFLDWFNDVFIQSNNEISNFKGLKTRHFLYDLLAGANGILNIHTIRGKLNGFYTLSLPLIPLIQSSRTIVLWKELSSRPTAKKLAIFASFFALVPAFNQVPLYLNTIVGLSLCSLFVNEFLLKTKYYKLAAIFSLYICIIGISFFAGESTNRNLNQIVKGERIPLINSTLPNISLMIEQSTLENFQQLVNKVNQLSTKDDTIVAMPFAPYLYFILNRKNPTPWIGLDYAKLGGEFNNEMLNTIKEKNPKLIIYCADCCSYIENDESGYESWLKLNYQQVDKIDKYQIFSPR